jgi:uncharacterized protein YgbK (DUF1537 family)
MSDATERTSLPHKAYLKIGSLEMEKARRGKERESALRRLSHVEARCQEIEAEKTALLAALAHAEAQQRLSAAGTSAPAPARANRPPVPSSTPPGRPFLFRY